MNKSAPMHVAGCMLLACAGCFHSPSTKTEAVYYDGEFELGVKHQVLDPRLIERIRDRTLLTNILVAINRTPNIGKHITDIQLFPEILPQAAAVYVSGQRLLLIESRDFKWHVVRVIDINIDTMQMNQKRQP